MSIYISCHIAQCKDTCQQELHDFVSKIAYMTIRHMAPDLPVSRLFVIELTLPFVCSVCAAFGLLIGHLHLS